MKPARPLILAGVLGAAPLLSGCVAAAIPVLAAGGVLESQRHDNDSGYAEAGQPRVSIDVSEPVGEAKPQPGTLVRETRLANGTRVEVMAGPLDRAPPAAPSAGPEPVADIAELPANAIGAPGIHSLDDGTRVTVIGQSLPAPVATVSGTDYEALSDFAEEKARIPVAGSERYSAVLAHPLDLRPETKECSIHPAAVLIDLDPLGETLDPAVAAHADPQLAAALEPLRAQGVVIGWITGNSADRAGDVRRALVVSGLDAAGHDELVLLRYPEERKQTRREDFSKEFCLVAIAGDDRSDFDELYQYIKNPMLAAPLDALLGNGWFLIPQPLT